MEFIIGIIVGAIIGALAVLTSIRSAVRDALESADDSLARLKNLADKELEERTVQTRIEEHNGIYYIYNLKDGAFLGQGTTLNEIKDSIAKSLPNTNVNITDGDTDIIKKLRSEINAN